ncbi:MAG: alginate lyase family protein [Chloroflexi bacterium]|nr:alginate lyase family protein [Chloroflexota bacterium]
MAALIFLLATAAGASADGDTLGRLNWGLDASGQPWIPSELRGLPPDSPQAKAVARVLQVASQHIDDKITPLAALHSEGTVFSDPAHKESSVAAAQLDTVYAWAACARLGSPPIAQQCAGAARLAIAAWVGTYQPTGNPINENLLIPLLQSIDLMLPLLPPDQQAAALTWTSSLAQAGDKLFASMKPNDTRLINNWNSWHLAIDGIAGTITADQALLDRTATATSQQLAQNVEPDGSTFDFHDRDALHYQVYDLEALTDLDLFTAVASPDGEAAILSALQFLQPYVTSQQAHIEFVHSTVQFDATRRNAGDPAFANAAWDPNGARPLLFLARTHFGPIQDWTTGIVDENYSPRLKMLAALLAS